MSNDIQHIMFRMQRIICRSYLPMPNDNFTNFFFFTVPTYKNAFSHIYDDLQYKYELYLAS